jgi:glycyl-tRNA synthetase beta chain
MDFLLEINTEEMPPTHVKAGLAQLEEKLKQELSSAKISIKEFKTYGTCRRLVVAGDFAPVQEDREEVIVGPPKSDAFAPNGTPTQAAKGFAKAQGVEVRDLQVVKTERGEYMGWRKIEKGKSASEILLKVLPQIIPGLSFPKMMRWGESSFRFSRPIKNLLCLFGEKVVAFSLEGLVVGDSTTGHKIYSPQRIQVKSFNDYKETLKRNRVFVDQTERKKMILAQIDEKLALLKAKLYADEELLEKLTYDVECPYVFLGAFSKDYLNLPLELLSTAMREGQKLFSVVKDKKQLPFFLGVADASKDSKSLIQKGNERVLRARLEDAKFFWEQDLKVPLKQRASGLKQVIFQEKLGSYDDKTQRLKKLVAYLCDKLEAPKIKQEVIQAAELAKVDLLTEMVREFPLLQGKGGGLYARQEGYSALISQAIYEHYQPVSLEDESPSSLAGAILSIADKIDSIVGAMGVGIQVTGSSDPFGLRRNAQGILKIILDRKFHFSFSRLVNKVLLIYGEKLEKSAEEIKDICQDFFANRLRYIFEKRGYRYDLINAALGAGIDNIDHAFLRVKALDGLKASPHFEPFILMAKRVNNIIREQPLFRINPDLFLEKQERELHSTFSIIKENVEPMISKGDFSQAQNIIFKIQPSLNTFFDRVLVMAEEKKLKQNRLALLQAISRLLLQMADYSQIVVEGEREAKPQSSR